VSAPGTRPEGVEGEEQIARWVRGMFDSVAPRYDLMNRVLSANVDRWWRKRTVQALSRHLNKKNAVVIDLCCGSGDLTLALAKKRGGAAFGTDFSHAMLLQAQRKSQSAGAHTPLFEADSLRLPLRDQSADVLTVAFGFRNFSNYEKGLREMHRVLKPGGVAAILELSTPPNALIRSGYRFYSDRVMPKVGAWLSSAGNAYKYLPESVKRFPGAPELAARMTAAGFTEVTFERMTFGVAALHLGVRN